MAKIELTCDECGRSFLRLRGEHNRNQKIGRRTFCSLTCSGKVNEKNLGPKKTRGKIENLVLGKPTDEYSPFRYFLKNVRARHKKKGWETDLTLPFLKELWETQKGICPITGWRMVLPQTSTEWSKTPVSPRHASLDRIEAGKPYKVGNVRYVSLIANLAKYTFSDDDVRVFAEAVIRHKT